MKILKEEPFLAWQAHELYLIKKKVESAKQVYISSLQFGRDVTHLYEIYMKYQTDWNVAVEVSSFSGNDAAITACLMVHIASVFTTSTQMYNMAVRGLSVLKQLMDTKVNYNIHVNSKTRDRTSWELTHKELIESYTFWQNKWFNEYFEHLVSGFNFIEAPNLACWMIKVLSLEEWKKWIIIIRYRYVIFRVKTFFKMKCIHFRWRQQRDELCPNCFTMFTANRSLEI